MSEKKNSKITEKTDEKIAVIRIRGDVRVNRDVKDTLRMLRLYRKNYCVVIENSPSITGMVKKAKDYVTWGEIDDKTLSLLREKRGEEIIGKDGKKELKDFFRLNSPKGGFERKGIKVTFHDGGVLGYRSSKINILIAKMI